MSNDVVTTVQTNTKNNIKWWYPFERYAVPTHEPLPPAEEGSEWKDGSACRPKGAWLVKRDPAEATRDGTDRRQYDTTWSRMGSGDAQFSIWALDGTKDII